MIDFHSHILPGIDDGAKDLEQSIEMLKLSAQKGVKRIVLTPHCYHSDDGEILEFIRKRNEQYRLLKKALEKVSDPLPEVRLGCELHLNKAHAYSAYVKELAMEGTDYIMLEMPMSKWEPALYDAIYSISLKGLKPIIAHIDRYLYEYEKHFHNLFSFDLTYQVNCDSFLLPGIKKRMPYFFERGAIHILGSDMHNLTTRTTHMAEGAEIIKNKYGPEYYRFIETNSDLVWNNQPVNIHCFEKMGFMKKLTL